MSKPDSGKKSPADVSDFRDETHSPSRFMRARRPELFSDSQIQTEHLLSKEAFDYRLSILTSKKQEIDFEHFSRRIAEQELCPNLLPQTGPTGGGDSKVDSETYPVSEHISLRWYQGLPQLFGTERWAFAFSTKREWRSKIRADVQSIQSTNRGYTLIYFISNQLIKDKSRAQVEDQLSGTYKVRVRILDRTWLLKSVFEHGHQAIAIETLHLDVPSSNCSLIGPRDVAKTEQLKAAEARIDDTSRYTGVEYQLVEDCLHAALLSRNLERPRIETEGRFSRAERFAAISEVPQQQLRIAYHRAWTAYWWYEDLNEFIRYVDVVEPLAMASSLADDVELAVNLWQLLYTACSQKTLGEASCGLERRRIALFESLSTISKDLVRPNNALSARTHLVFLEILMASKEEHGLPPVIQKLTNIIFESEGLIDYPIEPFARIVDELGVLFSDVPQYDELVELVITLTQKRAGLHQAGRMLLSRGYQQLRASRIYDAIRLLGRAQQKLALREAREELTDALFVGGLAYEGAGLLWAARANTLASANLIHADQREGGPIPSNALFCARKLIWLELQLGRVAHVLLWIEFVSVIASAQGLDSQQKEKFALEREAQDFTLATLLLKAELTDLMDLRYLPDVLERFGLAFSRMALLYALGHEQVLRLEGSVPIEESSDSLLATFTEFMEQATSSDLPHRPVALGGDALVFVSPVLGSRISASTESDYESQRLGERILAGIEALFSTSLEEEIFPYREELDIEIHRSDSHKGVPAVIDELSNGSKVVIVHGGSTSDLRKDGRDWFLDILTIVLMRLVMIPDPKSYMNRIFGEESGLARSINFSESAITMANLLGHDPRTRIPDWNTYSSPRAYVPTRMTSWHDGAFAEKRDIVRSDLNLGVGEIPKSLLDRGNTKHTERKVASLIDLPLWDKARWKGVIYIWPHDIDLEPWMAFGFEIRESAREIFEGWKARVGGKDQENRIRVSILTGVDRKKPHSYSIVVGSNLIEREGVKHFVSVSRVHRMEPSTSVNLDGFKNRFDRVGTYQLMPGYMDAKDRRYQPYPDLAIQKSNMRICPAWQIGENDPDGVGIFADDEPIIPPDVQTAPILKLLERKRGGRKTS